MYHRQVSETEQGTSKTGKKVVASFISTSPFSRLSSDMAAVTSLRISAMGLEVDKMPGLNGWTMFLSANVVTQVYTNESLITKRSVISPPRCFMRSSSAVSGAFSAVNPVISRLLHSISRRRDTLHRSQTCSVRAASE
ncbi:hypothetical protein KCU73_g47, partial [Aureobasidium melanogenum]